MKHLIISSIILILCSFHNKSDSIICCSQIDDSFDQFFVSFSKDSLFQKKRITFPLMYCSFDIEDNMDTVYVESEDWDFIDFSLDNEAKNREIDAYDVVIKKGKKDVVYRRVGIDNGININYYFSLNETNWYLVKIVNKSI